MKVSIKTLDSQTREFEVDSEITIKQFKDIISPQISIDADKIRLIFKGRVLDDAATVNSCGIDNATIHAVERLPPAPTTSEGTQDRSEPNTTSQGRSAAGSTYLVGSLSGTAEEFPNIAEFINRLVSSFATPSGTSSSPSTNSSTQNSDSSSRLLLAERFLDHVESLFRTQFTNNTELTPGIREYVSTIRPPLTSSNQSSVTQDNAFGRFALILRRYMSVFHSITPMINAYIYFLETANNVQPGESSPIFNTLYPHLTDATSNTLHSLAHALHSMSDILVYISNSNSSTQSSTSPFNLVVAGSPSDLITAAYSRHVGSYSNATPQSTGAQQQTTTTATTDASNSNPSSSTATGPTTTTNSSATTTTSPLFDNNSSPNNDLSSVHFTVEVTSLIDAAASGEVEIPSGSARYIINASSNPTVTANNSSGVPRLIRTIAGGNSSSTSSTRTGNTNNANTRSTYRVGHPPSRLGGVSSRRTRSSVENNSPNQNDLPPDPYLICHSIHLNNNQSHRIFHLATMNLAPDASVTAPTTIDQSQPPPNSSNDNSSERPRANERHVGRTVPRRFSSRHIGTSQVRNRSADTTTPVPAPSNISTPVDNWSVAFPPSVVPVIQGDVANQASVRKQPPFSDGYVCGTSGKKKKLAEQDSSMQFINSKLSDSFIKNLNSSSVVDIDTVGLKSAIDNDEELQQSYSENIDKMITDCVKKYKKIDPEKYPKSHEQNKKK